MRQTLLLGGIAESDNTANCDRFDVTAAARGPSACLSVTLLHPAKAAGRNEMSFGRDTRVVPSNTSL